MLEYAEARHKAKDGKGWGDRQTKMGEERNWEFAAGQRQAGRKRNTSEFAEPG